MSSARSPQPILAARGVETKWLQEMVRQVRPMVAGVQLSAPFGRYEMAIQVAEAIGPR